MNSLEKLLRIKFSNRKTTKKVTCTQRKQKGDKIINIECVMPKGTPYEVINVNDTPSSFSFSIVCKPEGKTSQYLKNLVFKNREEAINAGWEI
jgi:hypothetical protein